MRAILADAAFGSVTTIGRGEFDYFANIEDSEPGKATSYVSNGSEGEAK